jgi:UDP-2,3-diacylglucosamine pyrophosphatase LpxH
MNNEIRPRLTDEWIDLIETVRQIGVDEAIRRIDQYHSGKVVFDSKDNSVTLNTKRIINADDLIQACNVDLEEWTIENKVLNKWEVGAKDSDGNIIVEPLFQVKLWLKRRGFQAPDDYWTQKWLDRLTVDTKPRPKQTPTSTRKPINVVIADVHLGRFAGEEFGLYNFDVARERLIKIAGIANATERPVNVFMLGDMIESFTGKNKPNTWKQIEMHGAEVALSAYDLLEEFFGLMPQFNECRFVGGNHDRITDSKEDDDRGQVLELIQGIFKRKGRFETTFDPTIQSVSVDGVCYILTHGDKRITKMSGSDFVLRFGDSTKFNCILAAHLHQKLLVAESDRFTQRVVPPIATGSEYEYVSGWNSNPGFLIVSEFDGRVKFEEYPL